jgi:hypothetical protein
MHGRLAMHIDDYKGESRTAERPPASKTTRSRSIHTDQKCGACHATYRTPEHQLRCQATITSRQARKSHQDKEKQEAPPPPRPRKKGHAHPH